MRVVNAVQQSSSAAVSSLWGAVNTALRLLSYRLVTEPDRAEILIFLYNRCLYLTRAAVVDYAYAVEKKCTLLLAVPSTLHVQYGIVQSKSSKSAVRGG